MMAANVNGNQPAGWRIRTLGEAIPLSYGKALAARDRRDGGDVIVYGSAGPTGSHDKALLSGPAVIVGRKGSAGSVHYSRGPCWPIDTAYFAVPAPDVDLRYAYYLLSSLRLDRLDQSTAIPSLSRDAYNALSAAFPDLETQRRIVDRIDELFSELDDSEEELALARADLETYRMALLKVAITGELTADWRAKNLPMSSETSREPLQIEGRRRSKLVPPAPEQAALVWDCPKSWRWSQVGSEGFVTKLAGFEYTKYVRYTETGDLLVLKAENAGPNGFKPTAYSKVQSDSVAMLTRSKLHGGEILVVFVGAGTGNVGLVPEGKEFFLGPNIGMIRPNPGINPQYLDLYLRSPLGKRMLLVTMKAVAQPSLSMTTIRQTPIAIPSAAEQEEIVRRVERALNAANSMAVEFETTFDDSATLRQSIFAAAFRGDLVQ